MKSWVALWFALLGALGVCSGAQAAAVLSYGFTVSSYVCYTNDCAGETAFYTSKLQSLRLDVDEDALRNHQASLAIQTRYDWYPGVFTQVSAFSQGIAALDASAWGIGLDLSNGVCKSPYLCRVDGDFGGTGLQAGHLRLDTSSDNLYMLASGSGAWAGHIDSDGPYTTLGADRRPTFTGQWQAIRLVPEPGTAALFGLALLGLTAVRRRPRG